MGQLFAVEVIYRGVFQKTLAKNITRDIVLAAHNEGKLGISFGHYGDAPERNGIPAKSFAIVAKDEQTLEAGMAQYEPKQVDLTVVLDDTLCKGAESWAWYGLQPINRLLKPDSALIVTSREEPETLIAMCHRKEYPYRMAIVKGIPSFSGLWVYKDDHTDARILGAIAKLLPELFSLESVQKVIKKDAGGDLKSVSAARSYERISTVTVPPNQGNPETPYSFVMPKWHEMRDGITIPNIAAGHTMTDPQNQAVGGFQPARNPTFKKFTTRTMRPILNFDTCIKCTLCWLQCPDSCFDVTPRAFTTRTWKLAAGAACARPFAR